MGHTYTGFITVRAIPSLSGGSLEIRVKDDLCPREFAVLEEPSATALSLREMSRAAPHMRAALGLPTW